MPKRPRPTKYPHLLQVRVSSELLTQIDREVERTGQNRADVVRQMIVLGLAKLAP
jgi:metal-responsive CopG/Arc/MetJ family transcriptional regulator